MSPPEIVERYLSSFSTGDPDCVVEYVAEDFRNEQMGLLGSCFQGRLKYRQALVEFLVRFQNIRYITEKVIEDGMNVAVAYQMTANEGQRALKIQGVMMVTIADDLIIQRADYWDGLTYLTQTTPF